MRILAVVTAALLLTACTSGPDHNDSDVSFAQQMVPHHKQAIEMTQMGSFDGYGGDLPAIAAEIERAQEPEIRLMRGWLREWGEPEKGSMGPMDRMMSRADMEDLRRRTAPNFEPRRMEDTYQYRWLSMMIEHHEGAIAMAEKQISDGKNAEAVELARDIAKSQRAEIDRMRVAMDRLAKLDD